MKTNNEKIDFAAGPLRKADLQREIDHFMQALSSYPERFADNPCLSFEQHLGRLAGVSTGSLGGRRSVQVG